METEFIQHVMKQCREAGVTIILHGGASVTAGASVLSGYFDEKPDGGKPPELVVATGRKDWIQTLAHEFSHFKQWQDGLFNDPEYFEPYDYYDEWLEHRVELSDETLLRYTRAMQYVEWDAEQRTVALAQEFGIFFNTADYTRRANAYVLFYEVARKHRKWCNRAKPYDIEEIINLMPSDFEYGFGDLPVGYEDLVVSMCFNS